MVLISLGISQQRQAVSAGSRAFPQLTGLTNDSTFIDQFNRTSINPTNAYEMYKLVASGTGSASINNEANLQLTTGTTATDHSTIRTDEFSLERNGLYPDDDRTRIIVTLIGRMSTITSAEGFMGMIGPSQDFTALPTTERHLGIFFNASAGSNWILSSADGTTQVTTDTGIAAAAATTVTVRITQTGINDAIIEFFNGQIQDIGTANATQTVTAYGISVSNMMAQAITETTVAKSLVLNQWSVQGRS